MNSLFQKEKIYRNGSFSISETGCPCTTKSPSSPFIAIPENNAKNSAPQSVNYCVTDFRRTPVRLQICSLQFALCSTAFFALFSGLAIKRTRRTGAGKLADTPCSVFIKRSVAAHSFGKHKKRTQPHDGMTKFSLFYIFIMRLSLQLCSDWILFWQRCFYDKRL